LRISLSETERFVQRDLNAVRTKVFAMSLRTVFMLQMRRSISGSQILLFDNGTVFLEDGQLYMIIMDPSL